MSQFLQLDDEIINGSPEYTLTQKPNGNYEIELANEIVHEGTNLNKSGLSSLNAILGYNEITGTYNPTTSTAEFTTEIDTSNFINNQRLLVQCMNKVSMPATDYNIIKSPAFSVSFMAQKIIELDNGNTMHIGFDNSSNSIGYFLILDQTGNEILNSAIGNYHYYNNAIKMSDGNIFEIGITNNSSYSGRINIISQTGTIIKSNTSIGNGFNNQQLIEMSNGNILITGNNQYNNITAIVLDKSGNIVKSLKTLSISGYIVSNLINLENNNVMLIGYSGNTGFVSIIDKDLNVIHDRIDIGTFFALSKAIKMTNGNILIFGRLSAQNWGGYYAIVKQDGTILKSSTLLGDYYNTFDLLEMSNGNIMFVGANSTSGTQGYIAIINQDGTIIKSNTNIAQNLSNPKLLEMSKGNIIAIGNNISNYCNLVMLNTNGNIVKEESTINNILLEPKPLEMSNGNIIINGYSPSSAKSRFTIIEPFSISGTASLNGILLDTFLVKDKYYELVYNETLDKFIAEEVRNAN